MLRMKALGGGKYNLWMAEFDGYLPQESIPVDEKGRL